MAHDVYAKAKIVIADNLARIRGEGVAPFFTEDRAPVVLVAESGIRLAASNRAIPKIELRESALAHIRSIGAGDSQHFKADVLAKIRPLRLVTAMCDGEVSVQDESATQRPGMAYRADIGIG